MIERSPDGTSRVPDACQSYDPTNRDPSWTTHSSNPVSPFKVVPDTAKPDDVICGKNRRPAFLHVGNQRFRSIVQSFREEYQNARRREEKTRIATTIALIVEKRGGRFMKLDNDLGVWYYLDAEKVHEKISHALRSAQGPASVGRPKKIPADLVELTPEENEDYQELLRVQQAILSVLLKPHRERKRSLASLKR
jgi:hypothetical protein